MSRPPVTAIVCTMGREHLISGCLKSLAGTLADGDELIVVESGGNGAETALRSLEPMAARPVYLRVEPPGKCRQLNTGLRASGAEVVLLTDDDVRVERTWADQMAACFTDPAVGIACGRVIGLSHLPGTDQAPEQPPGDAPFETWRFAHGAAMAVRRRAAFDAGGFDERLGPGTKAAGEDHDFVLRVRRLGWRVVVAGAVPVQHLEWRTAEQEWDNALSYERGSGAVVGAALRRSPKEAWPILRRRLAYQRDVFVTNRRFGIAAAGAFSAGLLYGIQLAEHDWFAQRVEPEAGGPNG
jgi:glycosyltransferase involved in cell wall biosynthesis